MQYPAAAITPFLQEDLPIASLVFASKCPLLPCFFDDFTTATSCTFLLASVMVCFGIVEESGPLGSGKSSLPVKVYM